MAGLSLLPHQEPPAMGRDSQVRGRTGELAGAVGISVQELSADAYGVLAGHIVAAESRELATSNPLVD
jgi:hypothetical protein